MIVGKQAPEQERRGYRLPLSPLPSTRDPRQPVVLVALVVVATLVTLGLPASAAPVESVSYELSVDPTDQTVCLGSSTYISVSITRTLTVAGVPQPIVGRREGGRLKAESHDPGVARLVNSRAAVPPGTGLFALFAVEAVGIGTATLSFGALATGDEALISYDVSRMTGIIARVKVVQCWEAYTSGLGKVWEEKNLCTLERPFLLNGTWPGLGGSEPIFYMPTDPIRGRWVMINTFQQTWLVSGSGTYEVVFHLGATVEEGNIVMTGTGVMISGPVALPVDPLNTEVAIRPISDPNECLP